MTSLTPDEARDALAWLEAAGKRLREIPAPARIRALGRVLDAWSDPGSDVRARLLREHPPASGLSRETVAAGLDRALRGWDAAALERLVERELGPAAEISSLPDVMGVTLVIHGGVIPMPTLVDAIAPLVLGSPVLSKPAARDPVTPRVLAESLATLAPELSDGLVVADVHRGDEAALDALLSAERVVVTGSDEAVATVRARLAASTRSAKGSKLVAHGHKLSVAVLGEDPALDLQEAAEGLAVDVALWDQLGCLSPLACWALGERSRARAFAEALAGALAEREREWPRGEIDPAAAARVTAERANAELRGAAGKPVDLHASEGSAWTVVAESDPAPREAPLHRFVRVHPVADLDDLSHALAPLRPHLAGVALAGLAADAPTLGASRTARFGELQTPPLAWKRDGLGVLTGLLD